MDYGTATGASDFQQDNDSGSRASVVLDQRLTLGWSALAATLALLTGTRLAVDGWWPLVMAWLKWPFPGWLNLVTTAIGLGTAVIAWSWRYRVEGVWRGTALAASVISAAVSILLLVCAVLALGWLIWSLFANDDDNGVDRPRTQQRQSRRRRRPARSRTRYAL